MSSDECYVEFLYNTNKQEPHTGITTFTDDEIS